MHLDVRRDRAPALAAAPQPGRVAAWHDGARRGWLLSAPVPPSRRPKRNLKLTGRVVAGEIAMGASADGCSPPTRSRRRAVAAADVPDGRFGEPLARLRGVVPLRFVRGGCLALVDRDDRWLAGCVPALR